MRLLNCGVGEDSWESLGLQGDPTSPSWRRSVLGVHWKEWCWSWNSNTLATWCEDLTHLKAPWFWEILKARGEGNDRGRDGWVASPTEWTWACVKSGNWWCTGRPGVLRSIGSQESDTTERLNWTELKLRVSSQGIPFAFSLIKLDIQLLAPKRFLPTLWHGVCLLKEETAGKSKHCVYIHVNFLLRTLCIYAHSRGEVNCLK